MFSSPKWILLLGLWMLHEACFAQSIQNLYFNSTSDIIRLNFSGPEPAIHHTGKPSGASIGEGIAHVEDAEGNVIIWVNASGVYDKTGTLMPGSVNIKANPSSTEIVICPVPGEKQRYYIVYNNQLCSTLYYSVVDMGMRSGLGDLMMMNVRVDETNSFAEGLEIVKIPCSPDYWLLTYQCSKGFKRFRITAKGVVDGKLIQSFDSFELGGRGELDYHQGKLGYAVTFGNRAFLADFDPLTGTISNPVGLSFPATNGLYGQEFSPDGSKAYFTDWNNRDWLGRVVTPNLFRYDFSNASTTSWTIPYQTGNCSKAVVEGLGQIELASDGQLYIPHVGGCQITVIDNPNDATPAFRTIDVNTILSAGVSDHIQSRIFEPALQLSADKLNVCPGEAVTLQASGGSGIYSWLSTDGRLHTHASTVEVRPEMTTTYTLMATTTSGCQDSLHVRIVVNVPSPAKPVIEVTGNQPLCGNTEATIQIGRGFTGRIWTRDGQVMARDTDEVRTSQPGTYQVSGASQGNGCLVTSDPVVIEPDFFRSTAELLVPNVFTPDQDPDRTNETFVIKNATGKLNLIVCNRWGKEVFRTNDYRNEWAAEGLPTGLYFYYLSQENNCFPPQRGWVQVLR